MKLISTTGKMQWTDVSVMKLNFLNCVEVGYKT